jgi:hypothetical protein
MAYSLPVGFSHATRRLINGDLPQGPQIISKTTARISTLPTQPRSVTVLASTAAPTPVSTSVPTVVAPAKPTAKPIPKPKGQAGKPDSGGFSLERTMRLHMERSLPEWTKEDYFELMVRATLLFASHV